jgi:hypothetical protein
MTSCLPIDLESTAEIGLAKASVPPPAGKGTMTTTALEGQSAWAHTGTAARPKDPTHACKIALRLFIVITIPRYFLRRPSLRNAVLQAYASLLLAYASLLRYELLCCDTRLFSELKPFLLF